MAVHDPVNGLRVGMLAGGLLGALITVLTSVSFVWLVFALGLIGGAIGFTTERRRQDEEQRSPRTD